MSLRGIIIADEIDRKVAEEIKQIGRKCMFDEAVCEGLDVWLHQRAHQRLTEALDLVNCRSGRCR